jgi:hypothetical protein
MTFNISDFRFHLVNVRVIVRFVDKCGITILVKSILAKQISQNIFLSCVVYVNDMQIIHRGHYPSLKIF